MVAAVTKIDGDKVVFPFAEEWKDCPLPNFKAFGRGSEIDQ